MRESVLKKLEASLRPSQRELMSAVFSALEMGTCTGGLLTGEFTWDTPLFFSDDPERFDWDDVYFILKSQGIYVSPVGGDLYTANMLAEFPSLPKGVMYVDQNTGAYKMWEQNR